MGDTLYGKPYGLTREEMLKAHHVLTATATAKKTPYQLDLEAKDRKPDIVPKVGDKVKIKSREWYEKWKNNHGDIVIPGSSCWFYESRKIWCGETLEVLSIEPDGEYRLGGVKGCWIPAYFEEVYPKDLSTGDGLTKASDSIVAFVGGLERGSSDALAIITLPDNRSIRARTQAEIERLRDRWLPKEEPELQTIKKHRFIKLEKL